MEVLMHSIRRIKELEVIDIKSGTKLGYIRDLRIDCDSYKIVSILIPAQKVSLFGKEQGLEIPWQRIIKVGTDVILVDYDITTNEEKQ